MKFINIGLDRTGLDSFRNAMIQLGFSAGPPPLSEKARNNPMDHFDRYDFVHGPPFATEKTIKTLLQRCNYNAAIIFSQRDAPSWLKSCEQNHQEIPKLVEITEHRLEIYGTLTYDKQKYLQAYDRRIQFFNELYQQYGLPMIVLPLSGPPREKWSLLESITKHASPYPHLNRGPIPKPAYAPAELVG